MSSASASSDYHHVLRGKVVMILLGFQVLVSLPLNLDFSFAALVDVFSSFLLIAGPSCPSWGCFSATDSSS